jgi:hypothetical protein
MKKETGFYSSIIDNLVKTSGQAGSKYESYVWVK